MSVKRLLEFLDASPVNYLAVKNIANIRRTIAALSAGAVLFCGLPAAAEEPDIDIAELLDVNFVDEVVLEDEKTIFGWAEDIEFHRANENSPVKCDHPLCFWNMKNRMIGGIMILWYEWICSDFAAPIETLAIEITRFIEDNIKRMWL